MTGKLAVALLGSVLVCVWPLLESPVAASEPLSEAHRHVLDELESRWWGWSADPSPIVPAPKVCEASTGTWQFSAEEPVSLLLGPDPTVQEAYIGEMLRRELTGKFGLACQIVNSVADAKSANPIICLGTTGSHPQVAQLCGLANVDPDALTVPESYAIDFISGQSDQRRWILVAGGDPVGCIHGGFSLMQLLKTTSGAIEVALHSVRDFPSVRVRSLRGVGESLGMKLQVHTLSRHLNRNVTGDEIHDDAVLLPSLDFLARHRINCFHVLAGMENDAQLPEGLPHLVEEAHRRGIKVVGGFRPVGAQQGDRSTFPCYTDEGDMKKALGFFRQFLDAGCDMLYFMADDYYKDKLLGHCPRCIERFGDLAGEQRFMLHEILKLAKERGFPEDQILFCPTHYDVNPGQSYLNVFNDDARLRQIQYTFTYLDEATFAEREEEFPHLRYALFYNGPRWLAYYRTGSANARRALALFARNAVYFPIYFGWHSARYDPNAGWFLNTGEDVRRTFCEVIPRQTARTTLLGNIANYSDSVFKGPVEYALWGHYCWNPAKHSTRQSEVVVGDTLFGPANGRTMAQLNRVLLDLTRIVYDDVPVPDDFRDTLHDRLDLANVLLGSLRDGYERYGETVAADYTAPARRLDVELGLADMEKYVALLESCAKQRGLTGDAPVVSPRPRYSGVAFPSDSRDAFFVSGGAEVALGGCLGDLYRYSIPDARWERISPGPDRISPRCGHSAVSVGSKVLFFGGTAKGWEVLFNDLYAYDRTSGEFVQIEDISGAPPEPRFVHAACADEDDGMWIFGGLTYDHKDLGDLHSYSLRENQWRLVETEGDTPCARYGARMTYHDGCIYLFGGTTTGGGRRGDFFRFSLKTRHWQLLRGSTGTAPTPRYAHSLANVGGLVYLFGGGGASGYLNDLYRYDPAADHWDQLSPQGEMPGPRGFVHPVCPDGKSIYLFGGWQPTDQAGGNVTADLYRYDIAKNRFTLLSTSPEWAY
ncbi:MAG: hypothetical protein HQ582_00925 [Planctomycetes bacterium]|nr:hypothetical protein [Planctomycetota bacterium]